MLRDSFKPSSQLRLGGCLVPGTAHCAVAGGRVRGEKPFALLTREFAIRQRSFLAQPFDGFDPLANAKQIGFEWIAPETWQSSRSLVPSRCRVKLRNLGSIRLDDETAQTCGPPIQRLPLLINVGVLVVNLVQSPLGVADDQLAHTILNRRG
jgi:hypothetical protein